MNLFVSILPVLFQFFFGLESGSRSNNSSELQITAPMMACDRRSDSLELVKFYYATGGSNWIKKWNLTTAINTWYGITLNTEGCVICIDMDNIPNCQSETDGTNNLNGSLIDLDLNLLEILNVSNNLLIGEIPNFSKLPNLIRLYLRNNGFVGAIPNFNSIPNLDILTLGNNQLSGSIPNFDRVPKLSILELTQNQLSGSIPNFNKVPELTRLEISNNQLSGSIPNFTNLPNLDRLIASSCQFSGTIPDFTNLPKVTELNLNFNRLNGSLPNFTNLQNLQQLYLIDNKITGSLPNFNKMPKLKILNLFKNNLSGNIPSFENLISLEYLALYGNQLTGSIPNFSNLSNLQYLVLSYNNLKGVIPFNYNSNPKLEAYSTRDNKFSFSDIIINLFSIKHQVETQNQGSFDYSPQQKIYSDTTITIHLNTNYPLDLLIDDTVTTSTYTWYKNDVLYKTIKGSNKLPFTPFTSNDAGTYTVKITNPLAPQLTLESWPIQLVTSPQLICDRRSDSLELVKFYNATAGPNWWKKWDLTSPISSWHGIEIEGGCVVSIDLEDTVENNSCCNGRGNNLIGPIISVNLPFLKFLDLGKNKLTGVIPNLSMFPNLEYLDLHGNNLSGIIPNFDKLPKLTLMDLGANQLISPIPNFENLSSLTKLVLDENQFAGTIPNFDKLPNLSTLTISINALTGSIPNFDKLSNLKTLGLVANQLTGTIPNFNNLPLLEALHLRINQLTGTIPNFDKLPNLLELELSNNNLIGQIPEFDRLTKLHAIGIRANQLTGALPTFSKCPNIIIIDAAENNLSGYLPDYTTNLHDLSSISFRNNKYSFSGIIKNLNKIQSQVETLLYVPQQKIYSDTTITISPNTNYTLDLLIDDTVTTSTYTWYRNGVLDTTIKGSNKLPFTPFTSSDAGTYTVKVTNPLAPQLTLESWPILLVAGPNKICSRKSDSLELVRLFDSLDGKNWMPKWDLIKPLNNWPGVTLSNTGCVETLRLPGSKLKGKMIDLQLPGLLILNLSGNQISGSIPDFSNIALLKSLAIGGNDWSGKIPDFSQLPELEEIDLPNGTISTAIPNFSKIPKLKSLILTNQKLTETIPDFTKLPMLRMLLLNSNPLTGNIPVLANCPLLEQINMNNCLLGGQIPPFSNFTNLKFLAVAANNLTGTLPPFAQNNKLEELIVSQNKLSGLLPTYTNLKELKVLHIDNNNFIGYISNIGSNNQKISLVDFKQNKYTFSGIIQNISTIGARIAQNKIKPSDSLSYAPQQKIYVDTTINICPNTNYTLNLLVDDTVSTSSYAWYKNGVLDTTIKGSNKLPFAPFTANDVGTYTVKITNPLAPQLTLESWPIRLNATNNLSTNFLINDASCKNNDGAIVVSVSGGSGAYIYEWSNGAEIDRISGVPSGGYGLKVTDSQGCTKTDTIGIRRVNTSANILVQKRPTCLNTKDGIVLPDFSKITGIPPFSLKWLGEGNQVGNAFHNVGTSLVRLIITDFKGCSDTASITLVPENNGENIINPRDTSLSCGLSLMLRPITGQNLTNPAYFTGPGRTGTQYNAGQVITSTTILFLHSGTGNCADEDTFRIQFVSPDFILRPDTVKIKKGASTPFCVLANDQIPSGLSLTITIDQPQNGKIIYSQSTGCGTYTPNDNFSGKEVLNYTVCINGCPNACKSSTITFEVEGPCGDRNSLILPNIIFPTGSSGTNRYFIVEAITKCPDSWGPKPHKLQVFNRWGDLVYRNDNYLNDWEGTNTAGQPLPEGTYYYLLDLGSVAAPIKGYVAIVR